MKRNILKKIGLLLVFLFITFFSIKINTNAANFKYADFNWEEFLKQNKTYWDGECKNSKDEECIDKVLKTKEKFYTRLYQMLAKVEKDYNIIINDNIIIATVFYDLTIDSFKDDGDAYNIDESESKDEYVGNTGNDVNAAQEYFEKETDSLKTLINAFIGYTSTCYGVSSSQPITNSETNEKKCPNDLIVDDNNCLIKIDTYKGSFFDALGLTILGSDNDEKCKNQASEFGYSETRMKTSSEETVNEDFYWDFLENSRYFDNKDYLKSYFSLVLNKTDYTTMKEFYEKTDSTTQKEYEDEIKICRKSIIDAIKDIIKSYGEENFSKVSQQLVNAKQNRYWWPIGGSEITESDGKKMAVGDPVSTSVTSRFGPREGSDIVGTQHSGLDIGGESGVTPVIAAQSGTVVRGALDGTGSCVEGDLSCGGKYGNYVIIQHTDGNYTLYAHMSTGSVIVKEGDTVSQGQVLGYVGSTGNSTGPHLHFEVRVGGNDYNSVQDPLNFISADDPRGSSDITSEFTKMLHYFEGGCNAKTNGNNYVVIDDGVGIPTAGYGVALKYNIDNFKNYGIDVTNMTFGDELPKDVVDAIEMIKVKSFQDNVKSSISSAGITLSDYQIDCLTMVAYQFGNIGNLPSMYKQYGNVDTLINVVHSTPDKGKQWYYFKDNPSTGNGRAKATWDLFHEGKYTYYNCG